MGLFDAFSSSSGTQAAAQSRDAEVKAAKQGLSKSNNQLEKGARAYTGVYREAQQPFQGLLQSDLAGYNAYQDALGLNGPEGVASAQSRFQTSPGYQFQLDQGLESINRRRAAGGMLASGNADIDAIRFASGLADQEWSSYLDRLGGFNPQATAGAQANILTGLGNQYAGTSSQMAANTSNAFNQIGAANSAYAQNVYGAQQQALANQWNAIGAAANLGTKVIGMGIG